MATMTAREFMDLGYLREVNRNYLHPLGLALAIEHNTETDEWYFGEVTDSRDDPEGIVFGELRDKKLAESQAKRIRDESHKKLRTRWDRFGWSIQPPGTVVAE